MEERFVVKSYWSKTWRRRFWQIIDTQTGEWVYEDANKLACHSRAKRLNREHNATTSGNDAQVTA